ncbi:calpain-B-like [Anopheles aquasalis]|uniref:calpain-B-like n=1 Tax=Anopheles aquasalis TaxID=42839 RepID=UPI00215B4B42|nr:calpain-B-like [Anopheles aquasalis]
MVSKDHSQGRRKCFKRIAFDQNGGVVPANSNTMSIGWDVQDFSHLRDECVKNKCHFVDPLFPADDSSLYGPEGPMKEDQLEGKIVWKRPTEICEEPKFTTDGISRFDIQLGRLKNSWLITALVSLTAHPTLLDRVVPVDNYKTDGEAYAGIYHFRFWRFGQWYDVVIDDRLPTVGGELVYMRSSAKDEFWSALLEKAYAKLHGSYAALQRGLAGEAMVDLTGGISESYSTKYNSQSLLPIMECAGQSALVSCCIDGSAVGTVTPQGLVVGYSYAITKAVTVLLEDGSQSISLVRLRSPIADGKEWNGDWSDKCGKWRKVSPEMKRSLGAVDQADGEFWMCLDNFIQHFDRMDVCNLTVTGLNAIGPTDEAHAGWLEKCYTGQWEKNVSAGGSIDCSETHWKNPQYVIELKPSSGGDSDGTAGRPWTLIVSLMQKEHRTKAQDASEWLPIGFALYELASSEGIASPLPKEWFDHQTRIRCCAHKCRREATERFELAAGTYVLIPSTTKPNQVGDFMLRVYSRAEIGMEENDCVQLACVPKLRPNDALCETIRGKAEKMFISFHNGQGELDWMQLKMVLDKHYAKQIELVSEGIKKVYQRPTNLTHPDVKTKLSASKTESGYSASFECEGIFNLILCCFPRASPGELEPFNDEVELIAKDAGPPGFSKDTCRMMIAMLDEDDSATLGKREFLKLIAMIEQLKKDFEYFDTDQSGSLDSPELKNALRQSSGITLNREILTILMRRYSTRGEKIWFDDYIALVFKMQTIRGHMINTGWNPKEKLSPKMQNFLLTMFKL